MDQNLLLYCVAETNSGFKVAMWTNRLIAALEEEGIVSGWAFQRFNGDPMRMKNFEDIVFNILLEIQDERPDLIPTQVEVVVDYGLARSFRRGCSTRVQNKKVGIDLQNYFFRWTDKPGKDQPYFQGGMMVHYADQKNMVEQFLRFSQVI